MGTQREVQDASIEPGELVYDSDNEVVGRVIGFTNEGFEVEVVESEGEVESEETEVEELPGKEFGEGYLMWRCEECGEMDELDEGLPESCPNCGAPKEAISAARED
ncbi:rubredoxin-like domain-containing protein [Halorubrum sp. CSM-61]|uniref:DUF7130 family rubredoxin-like protein n=1 Tax=Halorubrum sp. CSM-61 TaxID=2485838 RepID=UPI000F4C3291|nr:hypothetical protein [Halorubrum sp. CSM-61]